MMEDLRLEYRLEIIHLYEVSSSSESEIGRKHGLNSLTLLTVLKKRSKYNYVLNLSQLILFLSFISTYCWNFSVISVCDCVMNIMRCNQCYKCNVIDTGTIDSKNFIQLYYKDGYLHYECCNITVTSNKNK
jgi:hypothetical protein